MNHADRNLLFGILAVQMNFVGRDAPIAAMHAWVLEKSQPLGRILVEQQALSAARHESTGPSGSGTRAARRPMRC
jgi:hypothetical protein